MVKQTKIENLGGECEAVEYYEGKTTILDPELQIRSKIAGLI